jgi:hypothetical protein
MLAEWIAECSADDPTLVVPWSAPEAGLQFVDIRANPYDIADISEAERYPALGRALRALNATRSPFLTAKCDTWMLPSPEREHDLENLRIELDQELEDSQAGFACYIDLLWRERSVFASFHQHSSKLDQLTRRASKLPHDEASLQCVLRPALVDLGTPLEGYAVTLYISAVGPEPATAYARWSAALEDVTNLLRSRDLELARGSATIGN